MVPPVSNFISQIDQRLRNGTPVCINRPDRAILLPDQGAVIKNGDRTNGLLPSTNQLLDHEAIGSRWKLRLSRNHPHKSVKKDGGMDDHFD